LPVTLTSAYVGNPLTDGESAIRSVLPRQTPLTDGQHADRRHTRIYRKFEIAPLALQREHFQEKGIHAPSEHATKFCDFDGDDRDADL